MLVMFSEVTPIGMVRGRVRAFPLYCALVRLNRVLAIEMTKLVYEVNGVTLCKLTDNQVRAPTVLLPTFALMPRKTGYTTAIVTFP